MKKRLFCLLLLLAVTGLFACAAPMQLLVDVDRNRIEEAWEVAYNTAGTLGYVSGQHDVEKKIVHFYRREIDTVPLPMNLHIRIEMDTSVDPPVLRMEGKDEDIAGEDEQVLDDMNKIATMVHRCCGIYEKIDVPEKVSGPEE